MVAAAPIPSTQPSFTAFDCDKPTEVRVTKIPIDCQHEPEDLKLGSDVNISLWQEASKDFLGILCKVERTEWMFYCGVWSHQSLVAPGKTMRPVEVTVEDCRRMHKEGTWQDKSGKEHKVMGEGTTYANYVEAGSLSYYDNKVTCQGAEVRTEGGERYKRVVKLVDLKVEVKHVVVKPTEQGYEVSEAFMYIRSQEVKGGGVARGTEGTLVLDIYPHRDAARCNLVALGHLTVQAATVREQGEFLKVFFSRQHKLYLLQKNATREEKGCTGNSLWETNLPNIFVKREAGNERKETKAGELEPTVRASLANHITELADYTTAELRLELEHARRRETCLRYLNSLKGSTVGFQPGQEAGTITEIKGEVATSITCNPVSVRGRESESQCYSDMPVQYLGEPRYLEPISRVLKDSSNTCPCDQAPALLSQDDQLFRVDPGLTRLADVGEKIMKEEISADTVAGKGVYPAAALETAQRLLTGRWDEETRLRGNVWNLSQPVWHPTPGKPDSSWSWEHLFAATRWLTWGGKIMMGVISAYLAVRGGVWAAGAFGVWRGVQTEAADSVTTKLMRMARALCSYYSEGVTRGSRNCKNESDTVAENSTKKEAKSFSLGKDP